MLGKGKANYFLDFYRLSTDIVYLQLLFGHLFQFSPIDHLFSVLLTLVLASALFFGVLIGGSVTIGVIAEVLLSGVKKSTMLFHAEVSLSIQLSFFPSSPSVSSDPSPFSTGLLR